MSSYRRRRVPGVVGAALERVVRPGRARAMIVIIIIIIIIIIILIVVIHNANNDNTHNDINNDKY